MAEEPRVCEHSNPECGCYTRDGRVWRHAFRFLEGDRVRHSTWKGFTGTVIHDTVAAHGWPLRVRWDPIPGMGATPPERQDVWTVDHLENLEVRS